MPPPEGGVTPNNQHKKNPAHTQTQTPTTTSSTSTSRQKQNQKTKIATTSPKLRDRTSEKKKFNQSALRQVDPTGNSEKLDSIKDITGGRGYFPTNFRKEINSAVYKNTLLSTAWSWIIGGGLVVGHLYALFYLSQVYEEVKNKPGNMSFLVIFDNSNSG
eukprot:TRINITY_DN1405_c0_g1_i1.p2 TRINITY_DN1405_c0_g1~~TRINITY_DN1405_c0_g1_i1.p2  ORF type:complete len:160 (-),score=49.29 TRINITY_DN1405_c0_g1_i1:1769-2248(-)